MSVSKYFILFLMLLNCVFSSLLIMVYDDVDLLVSASIIINFIISFYLVVNNSPDQVGLKLSVVYLLGFMLFICGRFIASIFGMQEPFCFEFGYKYCLTDYEKSYGNILIGMSLIFFTYGFLSKGKGLCCINM